MVSRTIGPSLAAIGVVLGLAGGAQAQGFPPQHFDQQTGEAIWTGVCQGCHMPQAQGAVGAGAYPALAGDKRLAASLYPVTVVLHGQKAMPNFGPMLTDDQIAAVVNYVRTHFTNHYADAVTPAEVKAVRAGQ